MHEPNHTHFFDSLGVLPEGEPIGYLGLLEVEPSDEGDDLLLMHGWRALSEAETFSLAACLAVLQLQGAIQPSLVLGGGHQAEA